MPASTPAAQQVMHCTALLDTEHAPSHMPLAGSMHRAATRNMQCAVLLPGSLHSHLVSQLHALNTTSGPAVKKKHQQPTSSTAWPFCRPRAAPALACLHADGPDGAHGQSQTQLPHAPPHSRPASIIASTGCCVCKSLCMPACSCMPKAGTWELCGCTTVASPTASPSPSLSRASAPRSSPMWEPTLQVSTTYVSEGG